MTSVNYLRCGNASVVIAVIKNSFIYLISFHFMILLLLLLRDTQLYYGTSSS